MTVEPVLGLDPNDRRTAASASGLLAQFNVAGYLEAADVHVANRLGDLVGEADPLARLAVATLVRAARHGAVCVDLAGLEHAATGSSGDAELIAGLPWPDPPAWKASVNGSAFVQSGVVRVDGEDLYLDRHWREELQVCADLLARLVGASAAPVVSLDIEAVQLRLFGPNEKGNWDEQIKATWKALGQWTTILTGGPGTGKTASIARMLAAIVEQHVAQFGYPPTIGLAAPTGKAAARLQESVAREAAELAPEDRDRLAGLTATTIHRLLGWRPDSGTRFRHHRDNPLPFDVVVLDEVSMVSLGQMARVLEAVRPTSRLILVGDPHQLASVEAGAVLADLVDGFTDVFPDPNPEDPSSSHESSPVARLTVPHRLQKGKGEAAHRAALDLHLLADALRAGDADAAIGLLEGDSSSVIFLPDAEETRARVRSEYVAASAAVIAASNRYGEREFAPGEHPIDLVEKSRLLCAHRLGPFGVSGWNRAIEAQLVEEGRIPPYAEWYQGRPVLITSNDRGLGISNGDLGVTVTLPDGRLRVAVRTATGIKLFAPTRLSAVETVYAMTVHKSQGSEAEFVTVVLPETSQILSRELFYTAVTRARTRVTVLGTLAAVRAAIENPVERASGLEGRIRAAFRAP